MATRDALTGLSNRFEFKQRLDQCLAEARRRTGKFAVLYLDLDNFKTVNDMLGHLVGDRLLQEVAARLGLPYAPATRSPDWWGRVRDHPARRQGPPRPHGARQPADIRGERALYHQWRQD